MVRGRESGMPEESQWESFFSPVCTLIALDCADVTGDVVEFGCGYGTFTIPAAQMTKGQVWALDIEPEMVAATARRAAVANAPNVVAEVRDFVADGCGAPDGQAGYVMLFNILHIQDAGGLLREACRALAPGGKAGIIHWRSDIETPRGPSTHIRPTAEQCRAWGEEAGMECVRYEKLACCPWHWGMVMRRPESRLIRPWG